MEDEKIEAVTSTSNKWKKGGGKLPLIIAAAVAAVLVIGYIAICAVAANSDTILPHVSVLLPDIEVGGQTKPEARDYLAEVLDDAMERCGYSSALVDEGSSSPKADSADGKDTPNAGGNQNALSDASYSFTLADLGAGVDLDALTQQLYQVGREGGFLTNGWTYLTHLLGRDRCILPEEAGLTLDNLRTRATAERLAESLSYPAVDSAWETGADTITLTKARDGRSVDPAELEAAIRGMVSGRSDYALCGFTTLAAKVLTAQEIYDTVAGEMKNAGYDPDTKSIYAETVGAEFDAEEAQKLLDSAEPGETVEIAAVIEYPTVTAEQLEKVLFRDVLGTYTTHVGGSSGRIGNVRLSAKSINGYVLNCGEVFSYNDVVGQRTAARGYSAAPAYVKGETVDEIGGGICQTSSTLYMATLLSNLEIVTRAAHRYVPAYIPKGMDATVSWGGPEYRFRNDTDYPIKVTASVSSKNYLTITIYGTKTDDTYVKITNEVLGSTPYETVYENDSTLPAGTEKVKQTPYTGYKVRTYRNVYSGDGKLISSTFEASSDYKARNKIILKGPEAVTKPDPPVTDPGTATNPGTTEPGTTTDPGAETPVTPSDPGTESPTDTGGEQAAGAGDAAI